MLYNYKFWPKIIMWEQRGRRETKRNSLPRLDFSRRGLYCLHTLSGLIMSLSDGGFHVRGTQDDFHRLHLFLICSHVTLIYNVLCFCYFLNFLKCVARLDVKGKFEKYNCRHIYILSWWENSSYPRNKGGACDTLPCVTHERVPSCPPLPRHGHGPER